MENNNGKFNNPQPKGFSLDEILAEVKASKERAQIEAQRQKAEEEKLRFEEQKRMRAQAEMREAQERARVENEFRTRIENEQKARVEAEVLAKLETEQRRRQELFEKQYAEKQKKLREEAEIKAREDAERRLKEDEEARIRIEKEIRHRAETEYRAKIEAEYRAKIEAATLKREDAVRKARAEAEARILAVTEAKAKAEVMAKAKREAELRAKAEAEMHARIEAEIRAKAQAETKARIEAAEKEEAELRAIADEEQRKLNLLEKEIRENKARKDIFEFSLDNSKDDRATVNKLFLNGNTASEKESADLSDSESGFSINNDIIDEFGDEKNIEQQLLFVDTNKTAKAVSGPVFDEQTFILEEPMNVFPDLKNGSYFSEKKRNKEEVPLSYEQGVEIQKNQTHNKELEDIVPKDENEKTAEVFADSQVITANEENSESGEIPEVIPVNDDLVKKAEEKYGAVSKNEVEDPNSDLDEEQPQLDESRKQHVEEKLAELSEKLEDIENVGTTPFTAEEKVVLENEASEKNKFEYEGDYNEEEENRRFKENLNALFNGEIDPIAVDADNVAHGSTKRLSEQILTSSYIVNDEEDESSSNEPFKDDSTEAKDKKSGINDSVEYNFVADDSRKKGEAYNLPDIHNFEEYCQGDSKNGIFEKLRKKASTALIVTAVTAVLTVFIAVLTFAPSLFSAISPQDNFVAYTIINIFAVIAAIAVSYKQLFHTYKCLVQKKISFGFPAISGLLFAFIYHVAALLLNGDGKGVELFTVIPLLSITLCNLSDWLNLIRVRKNFEFMVFDGGSYIGAKISQSDMLKFAESEFGSEQVNLVGSKDCEFIDRFFENSFGDKDGAKFVNTISVASIVAIPIVFAISILSKTGVLGAIGASVATYSLAAPVFLGFTTAFQLIFAGRTHASFGAAVVGADSVKAFSKTNAMVIDASELFCEGTVSISGIKVFETVPLDEVISYAAAATDMARSPLAQVFLSILNDKSESLPKVESLYYRDNMGLVSTVNGKEVLIGNSDFMRSYGINTPTKEMEQKVEKGAKKIVYVAVENNLAVMLAVGYGVYKNSFWRLNAVNSDGVNFVVLTPDANITEELLERELKLRHNSVAVVPSRVRIEYIKDQKTSKAKAGIIHDGSFDGYVTGVTGSMRLAGNLKLLRLAQLILSAIGLIFPILTVLVGGVSTLSSPILFGVYLVFLVAQTAISIFRNC